VSIPHARALRTSDITVLGGFHRSMIAAEHSSTAIELHKAIEKVRDELIAKKPNGKLDKLKDDAQPYRPMKPDDLKQVSNHL
jgi:hypothetical protein